MRDLAELLTVAQQAVGLGYDLVRNTAPHGIRQKGDRDTVTAVDLQVEREIKAFLARTTPDIEFFGEEHGGAQLGESDTSVWVLDPIDGTSNFAHGLPLCAVSLALVHDGEPVVAAIVAPMMDLRYHAAKDRGAFGNGVQMQVSKTTELADAVVSIGDYAVGVDAASKNERRLRITSRLAERVERVRMFGSAALDLAWLAEGRTDATIILANKPWDTAAGVLLAREAGALVIDSTGHRHDFNSADTVAVTPALADDLLALIGTPR